MRLNAQGKGILSLCLLLDVLHEVTELVRVLVGGNDTDVITELVLLEELLDQVLEVALGEGSLGLNDDLGLLASDLDGLAELAGLSVNLDARLQEVGQVVGVDGDLNDGALDRELELGLLGGNLLLHARIFNHYYVHTFENNKKR